MITLPFILSFKLDYITWICFIIFGCYFILKPQVRYVIILSGVLLAVGHLTGRYKFSLTVYVHNQALSDNCTMHGFRNSVHMYVLCVFLYAALDLPSCGITTEGASHFQEVLKLNATLIVLDLRANVLLGNGLYMCTCNILNPAVYHLHLYI